VQSVRRNSGVENNRDVVSGLSNPPVVYHQEAELPRKVQLKQAKWSAERSCSIN
jgi:hypothetical protein